MPWTGRATFLQLALSPPREDAVGTGTAGRTDSYVSSEVISDLNLSDKVLTDYRAVVLCGVGQISKPQADALAAIRHLPAGPCMVFMGEPVSKENYNDVLLPRNSCPAAGQAHRQRAPRAPASTSTSSPTGVHHPFLQLFANEEKTGLDTAKSFTYWQADVPATPAWSGCSTMSRADQNGQGPSATPGPRRILPLPSTLVGPGTRRLLCHQRQSRPRTQSLDQLPG